MDSTQGFHAIMSVFLLPMWLLSGAFFPMDVGGWLGWIVRLNPLTYGVAGLRHYLQNADDRGRPAVARCVLAGVAGVCRRDVCRRLVDRRHALDREICYECRTAIQFAAQSSRRHELRRRRFAAAVHPVLGRCSSAMAYGGWKWWQVQQFEIAQGEAIPLDAIGPPLTEFELTERSGKPFRSADMHGRVWVATLFLHDLPRPVPPAEREHSSAAQRCRS